MKAPLAPDESQRLAELERYAVLDTPAEESFDDLCELAARICQAPIALISLIDEKRQWFKSTVGLSVAETSRELAFCTHAINQPGLFIVPDATQDPRFTDNLLVTGAPHIRFYAGAPLITPAGHALGTLCVIDREPREMTPDHQRALRVLSRHVMTQLELRRRSMEAARLRAESDETRAQLQRERALLDAAEKSRQELLVALDENQRVNQALRDSDTRLQVAIKASRIGLWEWDVASNRLFASPEWKHLIGCDDDEVPTNLDEWELLLHPDDKDRVRLQLAARLAGGSLDEYQNEFRLRHKDGSYRWIYTRAELFRDSAGKPVRMLGCHIDVTDRKEAEESLRESESRMRAIIENEPECVKVVAANGNLLEMNPAGLAMLQANSLTQAQRKSLLEFIVPEHRAAFGSLHKRVMNGESGIVEFEVIGLKGARRWLETHAAPLRNAAGEVQQLLGVTRDITERKRAEIALNRSEQRFRLAASSGQVWEWDIVADVVSLQPEFWSKMGYESAQISELAANFESILHPEDRERWRQAVKDHLKLRMPYDLEMRARAKSGEYLWFRTWGQAVWDESGRATYMAGTAFDITARKQAEEALRESEAKFRAICMASPMGIFLMRPDAHVTYSNPANMRLKGLSPEDTMGLNWIKAVHPDDRAQLMADWQDSQTAGRPYAGIGRYLHADGKVVWWDVTTAPVFERDTLLGYVGMVVDITERKRAETALRESEEQYRRTIELSPDAVTIHQEGRWVYANAAAARILGVDDPSQLLGKSLLDFMHPDVHEQVKARWKLLYEDKQPAEMAELKMLRPDGTFVYLETRAVPVTWQGRPAAEVVARDVTERKHSEDILRNYTERLQGLSRRLMEVEQTERRNINRELHDRIGQNLSVLSLSIQIIRTELSKESLRAVGGRLNTAQELLEAATAQVRNLMAELHPAALDDYGLLAALRTHVESLSAGIGIKVAVTGEDIEPRLPPIVELALFRIAQEALNNALKHAQARHIEVTVAATSGRAIVTISDDGRGFDVERQRRSGATWGFTIMRERAEAVNAALSVVSESGRGTRITVEAHRGAA